jgi:REP element-mobilizing transposase RayT
LAARRSVAHRSRPVHRSAHPVHVTLRVAGLPSLREQVLFAAVRAALSASSKRDFRLLQFSVQRDHLHLIVEGTDRDALSRGVQGLCVRVARGLNRTLERRGGVFAGRHHRRALRTPREVKIAFRYVLNNFRKHGASGRNLLAVDRCSSALWFDGFRERLPAAQGPPPVVAPHTWLARVGWRRSGLLSVADSPA